MTYRCVCALQTRLIVQRICSEPIRIFYVIEVPFFVLSFNAVWTRWFMMYVEQPLGEDEKVERMLYHGSHWRSNTFLLQQDPACRGGGADVAVPRVLGEQRGLPRLFPHQAALRAPEDQRLHHPLSLVLGRQQEETPRQAGLGDRLAQEGTTYRGRTDTLVDCSPFGLKLDVVRNALASQAEAKKAGKAVRQTKNQSS